MPTSNVDDLAEFLGSRVVRVQALQQCGLARSSIAYRCRSGGPWQSPLAGIVILHNGPPTRDDHRRAALLYCGRGSEPCVLTGLDALELHGLRNIPRPSGGVHVLVGPHVQRTGLGRVLVERTERLPAPSPGRWPLAPVARAAVDFARRSRERGILRAVLAEAVQRGFCTSADLGAELAAGSRWGSALPREILAEIADGVRSPAEAEARRLLMRGTGLPTPLWNPRLLDSAGRFVATPDAWFDEVGMAWEIDSREWHLGPAEYAATVERRNRLMGAGIVVVHHLPSAIRQAPARVLADLRAGYAQAAQRPRPPLRAVPAEDRHVG
jgi:GNAT superfamily N-acetyltransferase